MIAKIKVNCNFLMEIFSEVLLETMKDIMVFIAIKMVITIKDIGTMI